MASSLRPRFADVRGIYAPSSATKKFDHHSASASEMDHRSAFPPPFPQAAFRLVSRRTGETFRLRRVRGTRRQKWLAHGETPDNLCQLGEHKLFPRFQVGPSASVCRVGSIWAFVVETTDFSRPEEQWSQRGEGRTNNLTCRR